MGLFQKFINKLRGRTLYVGGPGSRAGSRNIQIEQSEICSAIIDCNATHVSRGQVLHVIKDKDGRVSKINRSSEYTRLFQRPNPMMTHQDFLYAMAWQLQVCNLAIAWVKWNGAHPVEVWPLVYLDMEVRERIDGGYAVEFADTDGERYCLPLEDLIVLRRKYNGIGYTGQGNEAVRNSLEMVADLDDGLRQAVQISNKIHGLLKHKKSMLAPESTQNTQEEFVQRMEKAAKNGGIVSLDSMEEYVPLNVSAWTANAVQQKQITDRVFSYWRTPQEVVANTASEQIMQNYYDSIIEPVWQEMEEAFTAALFTTKEQGFGNCMIITSGAATGASWNTKLMIISNTRELGLLTPNEYRELLGYPPVEDGDERLVSLNYIKSRDQSKYQTGKDEKNEGSGEDSTGNTNAESDPEGGEENGE